MKLYIANGRYVGTQAEARKADKHFIPVEVPTDKPSLIAYLNKVASRSPVSPPVPGTVVRQVEPEPKMTARERLFETMVQVEEYIQNVDYDEARRVQSLAAERMCEHLVSLRDGVQRLKDRMTSWQK